MPETHLLFLPDPAAPRFFLWDSASDVTHRPVSVVRRLAARGRPAAAWIVDESLAIRDVPGTSVSLLGALAVLAALDGGEADAVPASVAGWSCAAKLVLELVARGRVVPQIRRGPHGDPEARWCMALALPDDAARVAGLAQALPPAAHAVPLDVLPPGTRRRRRGRRRAGVTVWAPGALVRVFLDTAADAIMRAAGGRGAAGNRDAGIASRATAGDDRLSWEERFAAALVSERPAFETTGFREHTLRRELASWARPALGLEPGTPRACLRLDLPDSPPSPANGAGTSRDDRFRLRYFLQAPDDPSLLIPAEDVWATHGRTLHRLGRTFGDVHEHLLRALAGAARLFPPLRRSLREARPSGMMLDPGEAWAFLTTGAPALSEAGVHILMPAELTRSGRRRLRLRMRISGTSDTAGVVASARGLDLRGLLAFRWEAVLGDETLSSADLEALAALKAPLVRWRGHWVAVEPADIKEARRLLLAGGGRVPAPDALAAALIGAVEDGPSPLPIDVVAEGGLAHTIERLRAGAPRTAAVPAALRGTLRPYQERGLAWLSAMGDLGLGACLADDMGLGKTVQMLAFLLRLRDWRPDDRRPALIVCPTSVVGNWEREIERFAPSLPVVRHYGPSRLRTAEAFGEGPSGAVALTTYGLLRRDARVLTAVHWAAVILDEAQHIKNAASRSARAARALRATHRFALTGTPVENRFAELWSILEFSTPGLLGPLDAFLSRYALPIERHRDAGAAERLRRIVRPFILRRVKSDPAVIKDLPPKNEMNVVCSLTKEQATLYRAAVNDTMEAIRRADGMRRRGLVLALITALKQICNHPAQYLGEAAPLEGRSGKLARLSEMLEEVAAAGDSALVFTQFREMGQRLVAHLRRTCPLDVEFLHGGVPRATRDKMVRRFQEEDRPRVFVLSLRAGGTGLNLTRASHVFHFDRWWNPAVEDQATDRAYRIGQTRMVQVYKFLTSGTVEEKVDRMLEGKRDLASRIVGAGEQWITELDDAALRELFALSADAVVTADAEERDPASRETRAPERGGGRRGRTAVGPRGGASR